MAKKVKRMNKKPLSEAEYVKKFARTLPVELCEMTFVPSNPHTVRVLVVRKEPTGLFTVGFYLIDSWCRGLYDTYCRAHMTQEELDYVLNLDKDNRNIVSMTYDEAHNYIFGAIEYGEEAGFAEPKGFKESQYVLAEDTDDIPLISYEYGLYGKRVLECNTEEQFNRAKNILERNLAPDQYELIGATGEDFNDDYEVDDNYEMDELRIKTLKESMPPEYHPLIDLLGVNGNKFYDLDDDRQVIVLIASGQLYEVVSEVDELVNLPQITRFNEDFNKYSKYEGEKDTEDAYFDCAFDSLTEAVDFTRDEIIVHGIGENDSDEYDTCFSFFLLITTIYQMAINTSDDDIKKILSVLNEDSTLIFKFYQDCIMTYNNLFKSDDNSEG